MGDRGPIPAVVAFLTALDDQGRGWIKPRDLPGEPLEGFGSSPLLLPDGHGFVDVDLEVEASRVDRLEDSSPLPLALTVPVETGLAPKADRGQRCPVAVQVVVGSADRASDDVQAVWARPETLIDEDVHGCVCFQGRIGMEG